MHRHKRVAIVCNGASMTGQFIRRMKGVAIIAVNGGHDYCQPDYWFTLDLSQENKDRLGFEVSNKTCCYAAVPDDFDPSHATRPVHWLRRVSGCGHGRYRTRAGISPDPSAIYTGNSATGAIQLAAHMGARRIVVFGMDGGGTYADSEREPRDLSPLKDLCYGLKCDLSIRNIEVLNASPDSSIDAFPRASIQDGKDWICQPVK